MKEWPSRAPESVLLMLAAMPVLCACTAASRGAEAGVARVSVHQGVYTDAQAERGGRVFEKHCAECHFPREYGGGYLNSWQNQSVHALYERLRSTMPYLEPGTLAPQEYTDVTALLLQLNGVPSGAAELPVEPEALRSIVLEAPFR